MSTDINNSGFFDIFKSILTHKGDPVTFEPKDESEPYVPLGGPVSVLSYKKECKVLFIQLFCGLTAKDF